MKRTAVIDVVGLTGSLLGPATPRLAEFARQGAMASIVPAFPAVTCTAQSNYLTGVTPDRHGIVGNGWYNRELAEVQFWKQSNHLVSSPKIWDQLRAENPSFTCAQLFWWHNMYSTADYSITPRPMYPADGRKIFDIYSWPYEIRPQIKQDLGDFPFSAFWGPAAGIDSPQGSADAATRWIAESAKWTEKKYAPTLSLIYLPHLDYNFQRHGPPPSQAVGHSPSPPRSRGGEGRPARRSLGEGGGEEVARSPSPPCRDLALIDTIAGDLISFFQSRNVGVIVLSEYGITPVSTPVHLNRLFRKKGWLTVKEELGLELLDCGTSKVFAVADHQVAHIYLNDPRLEMAVRDAVQNEPGVETVLCVPEKSALGVNHARAGDLLAVARENAWFTYYYWLDDARAPDFARCVDIHRKPGYDPVELFLDPKIPAVKLKILWRLMQKRMGFRMLMDVVPLDATLVKGSHGRRVPAPGARPVLICQPPRSPLPAEIDSTQVCGIIKTQIMG